MSGIRVRFAPSPTGPLHIGGLRTALYNYLFAKKQGGAFVLRIEDTDQNRFVEGAEEYIMEALKWSGIHWDEGPDSGGPHAPYRQSERREIYRQYAIQLIESGKAYYAFDSPEELEDMRRRMGNQASGNPQYDSQTRMQMKNALSLPPAEVAARLESGDPYVVRFKMPEQEQIEVADVVRGRVRADSRLLDDKVLFKSDGMPTYHLANVVDDYLMEITHVIRGEEWLPSAPLHVMLYRSFGWEERMPQFAHLPLLLKPDGQGKLSKRDGERLGFPVFPLQWTDPFSGETLSGFRESGYLPQAFINLLAFLGWNPGTDQEIFSMQELTQAFSLERVIRSGARFDPEKARWFNHRYIQQMPLKDLAAALLEIAEEQGHDLDSEKAETICSLVRERLHFLHELWQQAGFFMEPPLAFDEQFAKKKWKAQSGSHMASLAHQLARLEDFGPGEIQDCLQSFMDREGLGAGAIMPPLRLALVGRGMGPEIKDIMAVLGKEESLRRIQAAIQNLSG